MLNMHCKTGQVICNFTIDHEQYTIQRDITRTKTSESIKSKLYHNNEIIDFKNESDLQDTLNWILAPLEVFLGTQLLMQDSNNIFELAPKERLEIFKNVFWLLGIDTIKERISDRKREISTMIKSRMDTSQYDEKIQSSINQLIQQRPLIQDIEAAILSKNDTSPRSTTIEEWTLLNNKITIDKISKAEWPNLLAMISTIDEQSHQIIALQTEQKSLEQHSNALEREERTLQQKITDCNTTLKTQQQQLAHHDPQQLEGVNKEITTLQNSITHIEDNLSQDKISQVVKNIKASDNSLFKEFIEEASKLYRDNNKQRSLHTVQSLIAKLTALGKESKHHIDLSQQSQQHLEQQKAQLQQQLKQANDRIATFQNDIEQQKIFECDKIQWPCPYISVINTLTFRKLDEQLQSFLRERDSILEEIKKKESPSWSTEALAQSTDALAIISSSLTHLERKKVEQDCEQISLLQKKLTQLQQQWQQLYTQSQNIQSVQDSITSLNTTIISLSEQVKTLQEQKLWLQEQEQIIGQKLKWLPENKKMKEQKDTIMNYQSTLDRLNHTIDDYKSTQLEVKKLKEDEKILTDLYQIFAKELLLIVVQKNLPLLQDLMNSYLAQVVDYQLQMEIDKKSATNDNIELFVTVLDEKGPREVKSLSGGQKVILKIVWMMAVASLMRTKMLFLDETINNLDGDTVAKVAELLKNFVEGRGKEFMLYVVTHSHQIQEMNIWDEVIELKQEKNLTEAR